MPHYHEMGLDLASNLPSIESIPSSWIWSLPVKVVAISLGVRYTSLSKGLRAY
jgi:hypothetical protein